MKQLCKFAYLNEYNLCGQHPFETYSHSSDKIEQCALVHCPGLEKNVNLNEVGRHKSW